MVVCTQCGRELEDGTVFCDNCGTPVVAAAEYCQECGSQIFENLPFCTACGAKRQDGTEQNVSEKPKKRKKSRMALIAAAAVLAVVLAVGAVTAVFYSRGAQEYDYLLYLKKGDLYGTKESKIEPVELANDLSDDYDDTSCQAAVSFLTQISEDGKRLFYPDKFDDSSSDVFDFEFDLYWRTVRSPENEPVKIDGDVVCFGADKTGKSVVYLTSSGDLCRSDLKDSVKLDDEVVRFCVNDDGTVLYYINEDGNIYYRFKDNDKEKICGDADSILFISDDFETVYFEDDDESFYKKTVGSDKEEIASEISIISKIYSTGEFYFTSDKSNKDPLSAYVTDDLKEEDAVLEYPQEPAYPYVWNYSEDDAYQSAYSRYEQAYAAYQKACAAYRDKEERDELRDYISEQTYSYDQTTLYYFDGVAVQTIAENYHAYGCCAYEAPAMVYSTADRENAAKVKLSELSEISSTYDITKAISEAIDETAVQTLIVKTNQSVIDVKGENVAINGPGTALCYNDEGDLYRANISGGVLEAAEIYDTDVDRYNFNGKNDEDILIWKEIDEDDYDSGELYCNKTLIDRDVPVYNLTYHEKGDYYLYYNDWDAEDRCGTLNKLLNGESEKIADDVSDYFITNKNNLLLVTDYDTGDEQGDICLYDGGKELINIDQNISSVVRYTTGGMRDSEDYQYSIDY